jgi:hypothetical protein
MSRPTRLSISVQNGQISCSPDGGHVRVRQLSELQWDCDEEFSLSFVLLDGQNTPAWPFQRPLVTPRARHFAGTLKAILPGEPAPAYKYTVTVGSQQLDPVIIVDK